MRDGNASTMNPRPAIDSWASPDHFLRVVDSPWYRLVVDLQDQFVHTTHAFWRERGLTAFPLPLTTRTVTCPTGLGSDSEPVPVTVGGEETYLADSMQFLLEYGCRIAEQGCYTILPSFRGETPDATHLSQFTHSEAEFPGDLNHLLGTVEAYVRRLAADLLDSCGGRLAATVGDIAHLERLVNRSRPFERMRFDEAVKLLGDDAAYVRDEGDWRTLTRAGERRLLELVDEFVWVTHFDHLSVPFYQAFADGDTRVAANADLFFGIGEVVGSGERHATADQVRQSLLSHRVKESDYAWYVRMKSVLPMTTSGFGLGVERFLLWVLRHDDIRDVPVVPRFPTATRFPDPVDRP
jgi:asparaginyl-tRNA synthetase